MIYYSAHASAGTSLLPASGTRFTDQIITMDNQDTENDNIGINSVTDKHPMKYLTEQQVVSGFHLHCLTVFYCVQLVL